MGLFFFGGKALAPGKRCFGFFASFRIDFAADGALRANFAAPEAKTPPARSAAGATIFGDWFAEETKNKPFYRLFTEPIKNFFFNFFKTLTGDLEFIISTNCFHFSLSQKRTFV